MASDLDLSQFWCWNKDCKDYGIKEKSNIVLKPILERFNTFGLIDNINVIL
jgi:hypothetical protein